jgi:hypothetical protein
VVPLISRGIRDSMDWSDGPATHRNSPIELRLPEGFLCLVKGIQGCQPHIGPLPLIKLRKAVPGPDASLPFGE